MATVPTLTAWTAAAKVTASKLNAIHDAIAFIQNPPRCQAYDGTGLSCVNGTLTLLAMDTETYDTDSMHSTASNTGRININTAGLWAIDTYVRFPTGTFTELRVNMRRNSGGSSAGGTSIYTHYADTPSDGIIQLHRRFNLQLAAGDYYEFFIAQTSGATRTTSVGNLTTGVTFQWLHP